MAFFIIYFISVNDNLLWLLVKLNMTRQFRSQIRNRANNGYKTIHME